MEKENMTMENLDMYDLRILRILQEGCRLTNRELAEQVGLSSSPVFERVRRLEKEGFIKKYVAVLDKEKLNRGFIVYCNVKLKRMDTLNMDKFTIAIANIQEVTECYNISGEFDFLLKVRSPDMKYYREFLIHVLSQLDCINNVQSVFVMDTIKQSYGVPI
ncbi:MAG: Lrp/AsnC family transcriptional regulator [Bacteroidales bacterium]|nr:Lrp/AsnC family transcriptional regulator [Bacteroidales bacterium]